MQVLANAAEPEEEEDADDPEHHDDYENAHEDAGTARHSESKQETENQTQQVFAVFAGGARWRRHQRRFTAVHWRLDHRGSVETNRSGH